MGNAPSSAANPNPNTTSPGERTVNATPPRGGTRTGPTASSPLVGGSSGLEGQSAPRKLKRAPSAVLTKPRPPLPNKSGPTNPPGKNTGSSARNIGPGIGGLAPIGELERVPDTPMPGRLSGFPAVSQLDKDAAIAIELQRQFEVKDTQRVGELMQARKLAVAFFRCRICTEDQPEGSVARIEECRHEFCRDCLRRYTTSKISERCFPIVCPICAIERGRPDPGLVDGTIIQQIGISRNHYQIFQGLQMISLFVPIHCRRCKQTMLINRKEFQETKEITCSLSECQYVWCKACQQPIKADGPKHSCSRDQENSPISVGDFSNSIEENQVKIFGPPGFSPSTRTAPNPFAPMTSGQPFAIPQNTTQFTGSLMPQHTAVPDATIFFGVTGQQPPSSTAGQLPSSFLTAPDQQNFSWPQPTGPNLFRRSILVPQSTGEALQWGVGNRPGMGFGSPQQQPYTQVGLSNSAFTTTTQTQLNVNIPQQPASTNGSPPPTLPPEFCMRVSNDHFAPAITPAPPLPPKAFTMEEIAIGFGGAALMKSQPPLSRSGATNPPSTAGFSARNIGPDIGGQGQLRLGTSGLWLPNRQQTGFGGTFGGFRAQNTGANGSSTESSALPIDQRWGPPPAYTSMHSNRLSGPPAVSQRERDAAVAVELQRQFEAEDQQLRAQRQALQRLALARGFRCSICMEVHLEDSVARIEKCRHAFCRDCLRDYTTSKISERCFPIVCPVCTTEKGRPDPGLVDETIIQQIGISNNHYQIFEELQTISFSVPVHCRRCEQTMLIDREEFQETKEITCPLPGCQYVWCNACQQPIKDDGPKHSCDGSNELQHLMQEQGWKICPGCQTPVQKIDGCNHISCITPGCNSHFCYVDGTMILKGGTQDQLQSAKIEHYRKCKLFDYD